MSNFLYDAGSDQRTVQNDLRDRGINDLDLLIASHAHADHIQGVPVILDHLSVNEIWYNGQEHNTLTFERFLDGALASFANYHDPKFGKK